MMPKSRCRPMAAWPLRWRVLYIVCGDCPVLEDQEPRGDPLRRAMSKDALRRSLHVKDKRYDAL